MPWAALPLASSMKATLSSRFGVSGIPMYVYANKWRTVYYCVAGIGWQRM